LLHEVVVNHLHFTCNLHMPSYPLNDFINSFQSAELLRPAEQCRVVITVTLSHDSHVNKLVVNETY